MPRKLIGTDAFQETPIVEVTRQITKHNYLVMDLDDLPRIVKEVSLSSRLWMQSCSFRLGVSCSPDCLLAASVTEGNLGPKPKG